MSLTKEQLTKRREGIGGSEIASIVGLNPYATALDVWRAKVEGWAPEVSGAMERGIYLEDGVAKWYAARTGASLSECGTLTHPTLVRVMATPDRLAKMGDGSRLDLSIKVPGPWTQEQWGAPGTDEVPEAYLVQVQWELLILEARYDIRRADIAAPIGNDLHVYHVLADADIQSHLVEEAQRFWRDFVETQTPPPVDGSESCSAWLKERHPKALAPMLPGTERSAALMEALRQTRVARERLELSEKSIVNQLKEMCGDAEGMKGEGWRFTWKNVSGRAATDWRAVAAELGAPEDLVRKHTRTSEGSRRFLPLWEPPKEQP